MRVLATPAYMAQDAFTRELFQAEALRLLKPVRDAQPSMVFGDPRAEKLYFEDPIKMEDGSTQHLSVVVPIGGDQKLWCKRDDHPDGPVFTFLLPSDY